MNKSIYKSIPSPFTRNSNGYNISTIANRGISGATTTSHVPLELVFVQLENNLTTINLGLKVFVVFKSIKWCFMTHFAGCWDLLQSLFGMLKTLDSIIELLGQVADGLLKLIDGGFIVHGHPKQTGHIWAIVSNATRS